MNENLEKNILNDLSLRKLATGEMFGPLTGYPSIDKPWLKYYNEEQIKTVMPQKTCYEYLRECNEKYLGRTALSYFGRKISFEELFLNIDSVAAALKAIGVNENDIITISLPNIPEAAYLFYACSKIGAIANMVDPRTSDKGIESYIEEVDSKLVIIIDAYYYKAKKLINDGTVDRIVAVSPAESLPFGLNLGYRAKSFFDAIKDSSKKINFDENTIKWSEFMKKGKEYIGRVDAEYIQNRPLVIEHTGGTTGKPKGVLLSNENINSVALQSVLTGIDMQREHNWLDIMPTFIAYGVGMGLHLPLTIGMETILIPQFDPKKFDDLLVKHKPIHMVGVPSYWQTIIDSKKLTNADLSYIIAPTVGGDAMKKSLEEDANEFLENHNCTSKITKGYGMTEVTGGVAGTIDENNEIGSVGIPFVKTIISVFDPETGKECRYNETGEVCMTGPNTMLGYYDNQEATNAILREHEDGRVWVHSGDIGYMTENGNIFIVDRMKRMIIRYDGFKVFPSMIEEVICSHDAVETCSVVGVDDVNHGQGKLPKAHIVLKEQYEGNYENILSEIEALCVTNLQEYAQPVDYKIREELPLTSVGKVDFLALEAEDVKNTGHVKTLIKK
ncbi:MAG: acyl--CoA ligase [Bacilli bacterium]|nr:acyl--CoA ligase [Bacilli bacterium]